MKYIMMVLLALLVVGCGEPLEVRDIPEPEIFEPSELVVDDTIPGDVYINWHDSDIDSTYEIMFDEEYSVFEIEYKGTTYIVDLENKSIKVKK